MGGYGGKGGLQEIEYQWMERRCRKGCGQRLLEKNVKLGHTTKRVTFIIWKLKSMVKWSGVVKWLPVVSAHGRFDPDVSTQMDVSTLDVSTQCYYMWTFRPNAAMLL